jgi:uncharacterized membrane protein YdjX (TVP38/TMEM64 family)
MTLPRTWLHRLLPLLLLAVAVIAAFSSGLGDYVSIEALRAHRSTLNAFVAAQGSLAAVAFVAAYAATTILFLPVGAVLTVVGGFLFGVALGTVYVVIGATLGATTLFVIARSTLGSLFRAKAGPFLARMEAGFRESALSYTCWCCASSRCSPSSS